MSQLEGRIRDLEAQAQSKEKQLNEWRTRVIDMEQQIVKYKQYEAKLMECETVNLQLRKKVEELLVANRRIAEVESLLREKNQLEEHVQYLNGQVETWQRKCGQYESDIQVLQRRLADAENSQGRYAAQEAKIHELLEQTTKLNLLLASKEQEIQRLKADNT